VMLIARWCYRLDFYPAIEYHIRSHHECKLKYMAVAARRCSGTSVFEKSVPPRLCSYSSIEVCNNLSLHAIPALGKAFSGISSKDLMSMSPEDHWKSV
jgi:hypothetical protein